MRYPVIPTRFYFLLRIRTSDAQGLLLRTMIGIGSNNIIIIVVQCDLTRAGPSSGINGCKRYSPSVVRGCIRIDARSIQGVPRGCTHRGISRVNKNSRITIFVHDS